MCQKADLFVIFSKGGQMSVRLTIGTLFEHFYLKKKNSTKTLKLILKNNVQNITPSLNITLSLKTYFFFQVYFLLILAALSNSLSFNALL